MRTLLLIAAATLGAPATALAQADTAVDVQTLWPAAGPQHTLALRSSDVQPHLGVGFALAANYAHLPLYFREENGTQTFDAVGHVLTTDFLWSLGLFDRVQVGVAVPLVVAQGGSGVAVITGGPPSQQLPQTALRDFRFDVAVAILQRARRLDADGLGLRVDLGVAIPTGDDRGFQGAASATFAPAVVVDYRVAGLTLTANAGARVREQAIVARTAWASQALLGGGVTYRPAPIDRVAFSAEVQALLPLNGRSTLSVPGRAMPVEITPPVPVELFVGGRAAIDRSRDIELALGAGIPLTREPTVPQFRVLAAMSYTPRGLDSDRDGVLDADDACPGELEDRDGHLDRDGCRDPDNDDDRVPDEADQCRDVPEDADNFRDEDGCPEPDNDDDGVADADDACATEAAGARPDPARAGCPVRDRDGDGVLDESDACADEPQGPRADPARPGCPLPDRDRDGVGDADDACASDPAGEHPDRFRAGCPDPDRDHDGVANEHDRCVDQPETINGATDDDGCPDAGDEPVTWSGNVLLFENVVRLRAGARALTPPHAALLAQAARRIRARGAEVERVRVEVTAGAGPAGAAEAARQAALVADALVANGVAREAITAGAFAAPARAPGRPAPRIPPGEVRVRIEPRAARP